MQLSELCELCENYLLRFAGFSPGSPSWAWMLVSYRPLAQSRFSSRLTMAAIPTRAGREAVERLTEAEATAFINRDKETIKTELDAMTFVPLAPRPAEAPAGPNHLAERLRLAAELDEARSNLEEQVAEEHNGGYPGTCTRRYLGIKMN